METAMRTAIGVDIGGTRLSVGLVSDEGQVLSLVREATPADGEAALALLLEMTRALIGEAGASPHATLDGIGIGFGGPVDFEAQAIVQSHHVAGWAPGLKLAASFAQEFGLPAVMDNDANCGGLGEALFGAARGHDDVFYVNVGTGIGGAVILDGRVHHGAHSTAGEIGHCIVLPDGPPCTCDKRGCLEALSSGSALGREGRAAGMGDVTGREVGERALRGDPVALRIVAQAGTWLGLALGNVANLLDPQIIVIGGGVSDLGDVYLGPARASFAATAMPAARGTPIVKAALGYDAGVIGAAALVLTCSAV
jgi:glucokinase